MKFCISFLPTKTKYSPTRVILFLSLFFVFFYNLSFYKKIFSVYNPGFSNLLNLTSLILFLVLATNVFLLLLFTLFEYAAKLFRAKNSFKIFFGGLFLLSSMAAYVMDSYGVVIDTSMLQNIVKTDSAEAFDLLNAKFLFYLFGLFVVPLFFLLKLKVESKKPVKEIKERGLSLVCSFVLIAILVISSGKFYANFFREQKPLRYYANPTYWLYSVVKTGTDSIGEDSIQFIAYGRDAIIPKEDNDRELIVLVIGETARRDRFSLNGHTAETNPLLKKEKVFSFKNVTSCGTSTAISVPCIFSHFGRSKFDLKTAKNSDNLLDVLTHTKDVSVLWRDNNSNSKGVAARVTYEDYKTEDKNPVCEGTECRDVGMLVGLQDYVEKAKTKDIIIVLHQMGNHGPAYFKRYPKEFEKFKPTCKTSDFDKCTLEEIKNSYDNAILYTDYFLSQVIEFLKSNSKKFHTAMLYVSDHGESLGENGVYLHSLPYFMAPKEQIEVPMIMWFGDKMLAEINETLLNKKLNEPLSHDNIFHTVLGTMEIKSSAYDSSKDILHGVHRPNPLK